jgi:ubiquinone/menaquinone biosynthesis C-methylase UbiE
MSFEKEYYENDEFWNYGASEKTVRRIELVRSLIPSNVKSLLDAGCGNGVLVNRLKEVAPDIRELHGVDRSKTALRYVKVAKTEASIDSLPFDDRRFEMVVALEVIEHLPQTVYMKALKELSRVAQRYILITVPNDQNIDQTLIQCKECRTLFNPDYHLRRFASNDLHSLFNKLGFENQFVKVFGSVKSPVRVQIPFIHRGIVPGKNPFPMDILCPVCGGTVTGQGSNVEQPKASIEHRKGLKALVKGGIRRVMPSVTHGGWLAALYVRSDVTV